MPEALSVLVRWIHITSVVTLLGGIVFSRLVLWPLLGGMADAERKALEERAASGFRPLVWCAMLGLTLSGLYNIFANPGHTPRYHMVLGVKLLLVLHVFAVAILATQPHNPRRGRLLAGTLVSGLVIVGISAYLRRIF